MKHATTRMLFAYWDAVRGERAAPERGDVQPGGMRHVLGDAFILSNEAGATTFRLAGTRMCALFCRDLAGASFRRLWRSAEAAEVDRFLDLVVRDSMGVVVGTLGVNMNGSELAMEMILLPLRHGGRTDTRVLGALSPSTLPSWSGLVPLAELSIASLRFIEAGGDDDSAIAAAAVAERRNQLVVHEGGHP